MTVDEFSIKHDICRSAVYVGINQGFVPRSVLYKPKSENDWHIDEDWFIRRKQFNQKVNMYCQDMYYLFMHSGHTTEMRLAKLVGLSQPWFKLQLFRVDHGSIMKTRLSKGTWKFFRFCRKLERVLSRNYNIRFKIEEILDEEAQVWERRKAEEQTLQSKLEKLSAMVAKKETMSLLQAG